MTSPRYQESTEPPVDYVPEEPAPPRMSRLATAALFVVAFIVGLFIGLPL